MSDSKLRHHRAKIKSCSLRLSGHLNPKDHPSRHKEAPDKRMVMSIWSCRHKLHRWEHSQDFIPTYSDPRHSRRGFNVKSFINRKEIAISFNRVSRQTEPVKETQTESRGVQADLLINASLTQHISRRMVRGCLKKATGSKLALPALAAPYATAGSIPAAAACCPTADRRRGEAERDARTGAVLLQPPCGVTPRHSHSSVHARQWEWSFRWLKALLKKESLVITNMAAVMWHVFVGFFTFVLSPRGRRHYGVDFSTIFK